MKINILIVLIQKIKLGNKEDIIELLLKIGINNNYNNEKETLNIFKEEKNLIMIYIK